MAVLVIANNKTILGVEQLRPASGMRVKEAIAGMIDEECNLVGAAAKRIERRNRNYHKRKRSYSFGRILPFYWLF